jgi:uncharacterized protein
MSQLVHRVSPEAFAALAEGGGGPTAIEQLVAAEHSKSLLLLAGVISDARAVGHPQYPLAREGYELLDAVTQHDRSAAERVIRHPSVGAWARRTLIALRGGPAWPGAAPGGLRAVAAAAAIHARHAAEITIDAADGLAMVPSLGAATASGTTAIVRTTGEAATVGPVRVPTDPHLDGPGWRGLHRVRAGPFDVLIDDVDPFRYPAASNLSPRQEGDRWAEILAGAWSVLQGRHPLVAAEVAAAISVIAPMAAPRAAAASSSSPEVFGTVAMSLPTDSVSGAETLAHEIQHVKLGALLDQVLLTLPDDGSRYYAPWRPDPRPLGGLLQGAYAYLGVSGFWRRQRLHEGHQEGGDAAFARWRTAAAMATDTLLSSGRLTSEGLEFVGGMARTLGAWQREPVSATALANAERAASEHLSRWQSAHGAATTGLPAAAPVRSAAGQNRSRAGCPPPRRRHPGARPRESRCTGVAFPPQASPLPLPRHPRTGQVRG